MCESSPEICNENVQYSFAVSSDGNVITTFFLHPFPVFGSKRNEYGISTQFGKRLYEHDILKTTNPIGVTKTHTQSYTNSQPFTE